MVTPSIVRQVVGHLDGELGIGQRRACKAIGVPRSSTRYRTKAVATELVAELKALAAERPRFGYRRLHVLLRRRGHLVNHNRVHRVYRAEGLAVRRRKRKRLAAAARIVRLEPTQANQRSQMDFVADALAEGRRFRPLNVVDTFSREGLEFATRARLASLSGPRRAAGQCLPRDSRALHNARDSRAQRHRRPRA